MHSGAATSVTLPWRGVDRRNEQSE